MALAISEKALGPHHPNLAAALNDLAGLQRSESRYGEPDPLMKRTLAINENWFGAQECSRNDF
jgi:hypothetical protein